MQGTAAPTATTVKAATGTNTFNVGSLSPFDQGLIDTFQGSLNVHGSGSDTMNVDDTGSTISKAGTLTSATLMGLGMGSGGITYSGVATLKVGLGSGSNTFKIDVPSGTDLPATTTVTAGSSSNDGLDAYWGQDFSGTLNLLGFELANIAIGRDLSGTMSASSTGIQQLLVGRSLAASGNLMAGSIKSLTVGQDLAAR